MIQKKTRLTLVNEIVVHCQFIQGEPLEQDRLKVDRRRHSFVNNSRSSVSESSWWRRWEHGQESKMSVKTSVF